MELVVSGAHVYSVNQLLIHKPDLSIKDKDGKTALDLAKDKGDKDVIKLLEKNK